MSSQSSHRTSIISISKLNMKCIKTNKICSHIFVFMYHWTVQLSSYDTSYQRNKFIGCSENKINCRYPPEHYLKCCRSMYGHPYKDSSNIHRRMYAFDISSLHISSSREVCRSEMKMSYIHHVHSAYYVYTRPCPVYKLIAYGRNSRPCATHCEESKYSGPGSERGG